MSGDSQYERIEGMDPDLEVNYVVTWGSFESTHPEGMAENMSTMDEGYAEVQLVRDMHGPDWVHLQVWTGVTLDGYEKKTHGQGALLELDGAVPVGDGNEEEPK
ncbi:MAG: hypothetical protein DRP64_14875 [Verrucomicrobia bacterium]|nr:MAG: hypothetical protein DRP64_14875 [Verrucomicrobiota bacterium]